MKYVRISELLPDSLLDSGPDPLQDPLPDYLLEDLDLLPKYVRI